MNILDTYKVDLLSRHVQDNVLKWHIGDSFFEAIDGLIKRGDIHTTVECQGAGSARRFQIHSEGVVIVPCDRCLADLELRIETTDELVVKLGDEYADEGDCVVVSETEGWINLAQYIYEFIALAMPISCVHEPGECEDSMMQRLRRYQVARSSQEDGERDDSETGATDERWSALKNLINQ